MDVATLIKNRRLSLNLTMKEVAQYIGVSEGTVSRWESGHISNMRRDKIQKLSEILRIDPLQIMDINEEQPTPKDELSEDEAMLLDLFRRIPEADRPLVLQMIRAALNTRK